ncbi:hypothetical protein [Alteribacillus bidgolensis]|uniref:Uncharacterized protein n=1 Tax=Alteribacillus bidgolensis TaxID=930129 RepID=A0A1G8D4P8_9BACI|nr:hypothetical protein [Alteribacillus bidgolensis]SDH52349.1 hypothetical protein SAMN05216352_101543 [Alteribacillus bidgolensis]
MRKLFEKALEEQRIMREERLHVMLKKMHWIKINLSAENVLKHVDGGSAGRPHEARA